MSAELLACGRISVRFQEAFSDTVLWKEKTDRTGHREGWNHSNSNNLFGRPFFQSSPCVDLHHFFEHCFRRLTNCCPLIEEKLEDDDPEEVYEPSHSRTQSSSRLLDMETFDIVDAGDEETTPEDTDPSSLRARSTSLTVLSHNTSSEPELVESCCSPVRVQRSMPPLPLRPSDEWINRPLSSRHMLFRSHQPVVLKLGTSTIELYADATSSGIYTPHECTVEIGVLRLCSYVLPSKIFRVHAALQLVVTLTAQHQMLLAGIRPQMAELVFDFGDYHLKQAKVSFFVSEGSNLLLPDTCFNLPLTAEGTSLRHAHLQLPVFVATAQAAPETLHYTVFYELIGATESLEQSGTVNLQ